MLALFPNIIKYQIVKSRYLFLSKHMVCCDFHWATMHLNMGTVILSVATALPPSTHTDLMCFCFICPKWHTTCGISFFRLEIF